MVRDRYSLKKPFEATTGHNYEDYTGHQKVWKPTPTYFGEGIVEPTNMAPLAEMLADELARQGYAEADAALSAFYCFVNITAESGRKNINSDADQPLQSQIQKRHYGFELDLYDLRTLLKGVFSEAESTCNQKAAELLGLCRGVGIPSIYDRQECHGWVGGWTDKTGWVCMSYPGEFFCCEVGKGTNSVPPLSDFFDDFEIIETMSKFIIQKVQREPSGTDIHI